MDISIASGCFDPYRNDQRIQARLYNATWAYRVFLYLLGNQVPYVVSVRYHLPVNFQPSVVQVERSVYNPSCRQQLWSSSDFYVSAVLTFNNGATSQIGAPVRIVEQIRQNQGAVDIVP